MIKLAGALLNNPALVKGVARLSAKGGSDLMAASIPGALLTGGLAAVATGNPLAGLAIGAADLGLSFGGARAVSKYAPQFAGKYRSYVPQETLEKYAGRKTIPQDVLSKTYDPSIAQHVAMLTGSIAAPLALEPLFMQAQQQQNTNQTVTQQQQLGQQEMLNEMYMPYTADGTLYQIQGLPQRVL